MSAINLKKSIILVGMMGCGKTSIGKKLAKSLNLKFSDLDKVIEKEKKMTCSEIFEKFGEEYFRNLEYDFLLKILNDEPHIVALGGGAFIVDEIRKYVKENAISIWINADFEILLDRVSKKNNRPLLEKGDKGEILKDLIEKRYPIYKEADFTVNTTKGPHKITIEQIIEKIS